MPEIVKYEMRNPYNTFRGVGDPFIQYTDTIRKMSRTFDEPTYYTFRLAFFSEDADNHANNISFDKFPNPLFSTHSQDDIAARNYYSSYQYLRDNNEILRGQMLLEFQSKWQQLQEQFQWYFQSISGLNSLMNIVPGRGKRVANDARLTISTLEGLDQKVTYLLNLYRKIAWDDDYQRWILPDMMRYFRISLYVTEFRTFHNSSFMPQSEVNPETGQRFVKGLEENEPMILQVISNMVPTYILDLERCEFDLETFNFMPDSINIGETEMRSLEFGIKVGNFKERYINPIFNTFLFDTMINGFGRTQQTGESIVMSNSPNAGNIATLGARAQGNLLATGQHQSGKPFVQSGNLDNIHNASPNYSQDLNSVKPGDPNTWLGNTLTLGKALVTNLVESKLDEVKMAKIPGLGISFNEAIAAIQSKNVFTLFGAARKALNDSVKDTLPSQELEADFVDTQFRDFLTGISKSEATDGDAVELQTAANMILNDQGKWEEIKDLSKATDLISSALQEINSLNQIENANALKTYYNNQPNLTVPVQDGMVIEGLPSSVATDGKIEGQQIQQPEAGKATTKGNVQIESVQKSGLGSTDGTLPSGFQIQPSSKIGKDGGESLGQPEDGLGSEAQGGLEQGGSGLGSEAQGGLEQGESGLGTKIEGKNITIPEPGEAVDGDAIDAKPLPIPNPSKATNNDLNK